MAETTMPEGDNAILSTGDNSIPRIRLGEQGFSALRTRSGKIYEDPNMAFRYPNMLRVVAEMECSPPVSIGLTAINTLMNRAEVVITPVVGETPTDKSRREYLYSVLHDMDSSWQSVMQSISTYKVFGHQVSEIVMRRRLTSQGSRFNDGLVGLRDLKNRPQHSIAKWNFSEDGRKLISISQDISSVENSYKFQNLKDENGHIVIPRQKFILFRCNPVDDNPEGVSILKSAYLAYKQLTLLQDHLMLGVSKTVSGIPFAQLPVQYMAADATAADAAVYAATKKILDGLADGTAKNVIFPRIIDPESKQDLFNLSVVDQKTTKIYDIEGAIKLLQANILSVLSCDSILMGADKAGSLSLQDGSTNMLALTVSYRLSEIANTLNQELVPLLWSMNGWPLDKLPKIAFKDVSSVSLEQFSKFLQRVMSVGGLEMDRGVMNKIREVGGFEQLPEEEEINIEILSTTLAGKSTSSSNGMAPGSNGDGTAKDPGGQDNSPNNNDNKA